MRKPKNIDAAELPPSEPFKTTTDHPLIEGPIKLGSLLSKTKERLQRYDAWLVGDSPLICHAWSEKAKLEMLRKQIGSVQIAKEKREPEKDFRESLYSMGDGVYGFPVTAIKNAVLSNAHIKRGIARTDVSAALWMNAEMVSTRPALAGARCDMPLVRIYGSPPEMREDMVRIGSGPKKTANLAYRAQFSNWAINVTGHLNVDLLEAFQFVFLLQQAGKSTGVGDWRNEKKGWFGAFHVANVKETEDWEKFAAGKGPLPKVVQIRQIVDQQNGKKVAAKKRKAA